MKYFLIITFISIGCSTKYRIPSKKYDDKIISSSKNIDGTTTYKFYRHDLQYLDVAKKHKLISRTVYDNNKIVYRYPILRPNIEPSKIFMTSTNNFLPKTGSDTIVFINDDLPVMNRHIWGKGIILKRINENSYLIKPSPDNTGYASFYISASHNYEEIENEKGFISDSLILPIR